ncbi:helix-turn-helix transcriptional regulator [Erythrobacter sp.]|uniref:helix-turn-helix transcriptional regulator n=1 Tax=Erythrobacter sp. TaxID=1042 RepID=UPI001B2E6C86|nr:helix-turn-helix transcriptional regulator [Erythrobacter sp.]MBO6526527.1 helix-turn-helix transcriptional regulator [Erythrobacter sp.]MBO6529261.1 helix-turn-helix transcriptional regulator [Erythrobacter sp.]
MPTKGHSLGNRIKELRARRGMTQVELADAVGVTRKTVNTVENKVFVPSTVLALKLAEILDVKVDELFYLDKHDHHE